MNVQVLTVTTGKWRQNCYLVGNEAGDALIIDPGSHADEIAGHMDRRGWHPCAILNTHAHYDHVGAVEELRSRYDVPFFLHRDDEPLLKRANLYRLFFESNEPVRIPKSSLPFPEGTPLQAGPFSVAWIPTPGHTPGSVCFELCGYLFSGDTLLCNAVGRTDLPGGSRVQLVASLHELRSLPGELVVCAGHGERTTLSAEFVPGRAARRLIDEGQD